MKGKGKT